MKAFSRWLTSTLLPLGAVIMAIVANPVLAADPASRAALAANPALEASPVAVLVRFQPGASQSGRANARAAVAAQLDREMPLVPGLERLLVESGRAPQVIAALNRSPLVKYAEPDFVVRSLAEVLPNDTSFDRLWGLKNTGQTGGTAGADIRAAQAWSTTTGSRNVVVAVIDTGIERNHPDLVANVWVNPNEVIDGKDTDSNGYVDDLYGWDFYDKNNDPTDTGSHGTHVAGTIAAEANNLLGVAGVCWNCQVMALRFLGPNGGYTSDAILALNYAVANGARISNNSWGGGGYSSSLYDAIRKAGELGHVFVAAAGNSGADADSSPMYPAAYNLANIVSVASTTHTDTRSSFSNYGSTSVDLGAPGSSIYSTVLSGGYGSKSGTSMASPHVAGVFGLLLSQRPDWTASQLIGRVFQTVRPASSMSGVTVTGGIVNAAAAVELTAPTVPAAPTGLLATALSDTEIMVEWTDRSDDESGFLIERSTGGSTFSEVAQTGVNATAWTDSGLTPSTTYSYQVRAFNSAGDSDPAGPASATTQDAPLASDVVASGEQSVAGTVVSGDYTSTHALDGSHQAIREVTSGGRPNLRYSYLEHRWFFTVPAGNQITLHASGYAPASSDGDVFHLEVSTDGGNTFQRTFTLPTTADSYQSYMLPAATSGQVIVRVIDSDATAGATALDTVYIDHLYIRSESGDIAPPAAPTGLTATANETPAVTLAWAGSGVESGFIVARADPTGVWNESYATVSGSESEFVDANVTWQQTYSYRVKATNAGGSSVWSEEVSAIIPNQPPEPPPPAIELSASVTKVRAFHRVNLSWSGATGDNVHVLRDGQKIATPANNGSYTDDTGMKSGVSLTYQICEINGACSAIVTVSF